MLTMIAVPSVAQVRHVMLDERLDAVVVQPDRLSMPAAVSTVRQGALPARGALVIVLGRMPPSRPRSTSPAISRA